MTPAAEPISNESEIREHSSEATNETMYCKLRLVYGIPEAKVKRFGIETEKRSVWLLGRSRCRRDAERKRRIVKIVAPVVGGNLCFVE